MKDLYVRTNTRGKRGIVRKSSGTLYLNTYPTNPAARRALNTAVNNVHASMPTGWKGGTCGS